MTSEELLTTVHELRELAAGDDEAAAVEARASLVRLVGDDHRAVSTAASEALAATSIRLEPARIDFGPVSAGTPRLSASVAVLGSPVALNSRLKVTGAGLRARIAGDQLQVEWEPGESALSGMVSLDGPAGAADLPVTGFLGLAPDGFPPLDGFPPVDSPLSGFGPVDDVPVDGARSGVGPVDDVPVDGARSGVGPVDGARGGVGPVGGMWGGVGPVDGARSGVGPVDGARSGVLSWLPRPARRGKGLIIAGAAAVVLLGGTGIAAAVTFTGSPEASFRPPTASSLPSTTAPSTGSPPTGVPSPGAPSTGTSVPVSSGRPAVEGTIRVGDEPEGVVVSPDSRTLYVANQNSRILSVVDLRSRDVRSVTLRNTPRFVAVAPDGRRVFVSMYENDLSGSGVAVIDAASLRVVGDLKTGVQPYALAVAPDGRLWVPIHGGRNVEIYSADRLNLEGRVFVPENPHAVAFDREGQRAFTPDHESSTVSVIDVRTDKRLRSIPVSPAPHSLAVSPDGRTVVVACFGADAVELIDTETLQRRGPFRVGDKPQAAAFATDSAHAYSVNEASNSVSVLDARTGRITATVPVGRSPRTMAVAPDGRSAYVSNGDDDTVTILRLS